MLASQTVLLSDLCSICNSQTSKYCCPRDGTKTCSLACVTKHKERALCDGKRDAAAFVKRSQLETAAGIDHDFNFLSGLERGIGVAEDHLKEQSKDSRRKSKHPNYKHDRRIEATGVIVKKAPHGLARHKTNKTFYAQKDDVIHWSVEWVVGDEHMLSHPIPDSQPINKCFAALLRKNKKRKLNSSAPAKFTSDSSSNTVARQANVEQGEQHRAGTPTEPQIVPTAVSDYASPIPVTGNVALDSHKQPSSKTDALDEPPPPQSQDDTSASKKTVFKGQISEIKPGPKTSTSPGESPNMKRDASTAPDHDTTTTSSFYLLKPETPAHLPKVLVPLDPEATLMQSLRNQVVLEYPTIVVVVVVPSAHPPALPSGYIVEDEYYARLKKETLGAADARVDYWQGSAGPEKDEEHGDDVTGARIAQVLQKDLHGSLC